MKLPCLCACVNTWQQVPAHLQSTCLFSLHCNTCICRFVDHDNLMLCQSTHFISISTTVTTVNQYSFTIYILLRYIYGIAPFTSSHTTRHFVWISIVSSSFIDTTRMKSCLFLLLGASFWVYEAREYLTSHKQIVLPLVRLVWTRCRSVCWNLYMYISIYLYVCIMSLPSPPSKLGYQLMRVNANDYYNGNNN